MERREWLKTATAMAALAATSPGWHRVPRAAAQQAKLDRIAIMGWSFDSILKKPGQESDPKRTLDIMDLPQMYADRYRVHNIEMQQVHFMSTEPAWLRQFRERVERSRSRITQINLEFAAGISAPDNTRRVEAIDLTKQWIDLALAVGSPRVMINQGTLAPEVRAAAIETLRTMVYYGKTKNVMVTVENRGANWEVTTDVVRAAGARTNPDLGSSDQETQLRMIRYMYPLHSGSIHAKMNPERYDLATGIRLLKELGYTGLYSVEASANSAGGDPHLAVQRIMDVLLATI